MAGLRLNQFYRMWRDQWKSPVELARIQDIKLKSLVRFAHNRIPQYRKILEHHGVHPEDIRDTTDLQKLPILTKRQIQNMSQDGEPVIGLNPARLSVTQTSGSTGTPARIIYRKKDCSRLNISWLRPLLAHGVKPWHRRLEITGPHNIPDGKKWYQYLGLWHIEGASIFLSPEEWIDRWFETKPDYLYGYSGSIAILARHILDHKIEGVLPKVVFGVCDLVGEEDRQLIQRAFRRPLTDLYGAAESGCIAWQCHECGAYHINADTVIVEFLREGRPVQAGSPGKIVITNLHSYAMPIIRYNLEDVGAASPLSPSCGRGLPLMQMMEGRSDAFLVLPSGRILSPMFWFGIMKPINGIKKWRVIQPDTSHIQLKILPGRDFNNATKDQIIHRFTGAVAESVRFSIDRVEDIPPDPSGKVRAVISHVPLPY